MANLRKRFDSEGVVFSSVRILQPEGVSGFSILALPLQCKKRQETMAIVKRVGREVSTWDRHSWGETGR